MSRLHLRQSGFNYSSCRPFTKPCERIQKFREIGNLKRLYRIELDKVCFAHNAIYSDSNDLVNKTVSDKILKEKALEISRDPKYDGYQKTLASMVYKFFHKKTGD